MKAVANTTIGNLLKKGIEYEIESENETHYFIDGIGWKKEHFDVIGEVEIGFGISFAPIIEMTREQLIDLICETIYECDNTQTPFDVIDRAEPILNKWMDKIMVNA